MDNPNVYVALAIKIIMKFLNFLLPALFCFSLIACGHRKKGTKISKSSTDLPKTENTFKVLPIQHATMVLEWNGIIIYVDPVGGGKRI
ncbi:MAG: hypothetical protein AAGH81_13040 [Bacteroidota bacterium]